MTKYYLLLLFITSLSLSGFTQSRIYVNINNDNPIQDGQSWETAYDNLALSLFMAQAGDSLWIAAGTYYPTFGTNRNLSFLLRTGVQVYGGFAGTETALAERDYETNITILSGDIGEIGDSTDNSYHVIQAPAPDSNTILDGLQIQHGNADGSNFDNRYGGGLFVYTAEDADSPSQIIIRNCTFRYNYARNGGAAGFNSPNNTGITPIIINCNFKHNRAYGSGGALYRSSDNAEGDTIMIQDCLFEYNSSATEGGAIAWDGLSQAMQLINCTIRNNTSVSSGAGANFLGMTGNANLLVESCDIEKNTGNQGAGIFIDYISYNPEDTAYTDFKRTIFKENRSLFSGGGGLAIVVFGQAVHSLNIEYTGFLSNISSGRGAGVYYQIFTTDIDIVSIQNISNSTFIGNQGGSVLGGAYRIRGDIGGKSQNYNTFTNCIFAHNTGVASITSGKPGVSESLFLNCTFYENGEFNISKNWAPDFDYETYYNTIAVQNCIFQQSSAVNMRNHLLNGVLEGFEDNLYDYTISHSMVAAPDCDMPGGEVACGEGMQYGTLPSFLNPEQEDFRIAACSPAIDAGMDSLLQELGITEDIDGNARILNAHSDLGAYEQAAIELQADSLLSTTCPGRADGALLFNTIGTPPFEYELYEGGLQIPFLPDSLAATEYTLALTDSTGCTDTLMFTIPEADSIEAIANVEAATPAAGGSISITEVSGGTPPFHYEWDNGDTTSTINDLPFGIYTVTITDENDCSATFSYEVGFLNQVQEPGQELFRIYPNPSRGTFILEYELKENAQVYLHDMLGRLVLSAPLEKKGTGQKITAKGVEAGIYFMSIITKERTIFTKRVIIME